jgi:pimeloyl-ACP methyl ester carboxylesterase
MFEQHTFEIVSGPHRLRARKIIPLENLRPHAPTMVFLHEGLGSIEQWRDFPQALVRATHLPAIVYDRPGYGGSDPLARNPDGPALQREELTDLAAVIESCNLPHPILVGHSDGGTLALLYAARYPERPLAVVAEASHVLVEEVTLSGIKATAALFESTDLKHRLSRYHGDKTERMFYGWHDDWLSPEHGQWNMEAALPSIRCPVLVVQGEADEYGTLAQVEAIVKGVSGRVETLLVPECGHSPHLQFKDHVAREVARFIAGL